MAYSPAEPARSFSVPWSRHMRIRLTRRLAEHINGIDLSRHVVGDLIELSQHDGEMLIAEGWATHVFSERNGDRRGSQAHIEKGTTQQQPSGAVVLGRDPDPL